jgi:hypothetical protein
MLTLDAVSAVRYSDPWILTLVQRLRLLAAGRRRVAYFYEKADNSTFRYRVYNTAQVLNENPGDVSASYFFVEDLDHLDEIADLADLLVICRTRYDNRVNRLLTAFRKRRKRVLFDVDDFVFNPGYVHLIVSTLDQDFTHPQLWDFWFAYTSRLGATLGMCDGAVVTNDFLAARVKEYVDLPVTIIPNFLNREQVDISDRIYAAKENVEPGEDGLIHFGYFSGTPSHNRDFAIVVPALEAALQADERLGVVLVGYIDAGPLARFGSRVQRFPFQDFINLQRVIGCVEFNLMPLQSNVFTHCKSELKYFEAAVVGTQSIASPSHTYARSVRDGHNGYIAQSHQWESVIHRAVREMDGYRAMAKRSHDDARVRFAWFNQRPCILSALGLM